MNTPKRVLLVLAFSTLVGCRPTPSQPATTPIIQTDPPPLRLYAARATAPLMHDLTAAYNDPNLTFETRTGSMQSVLNLLIEGETPYILANYLPPDMPLWAAPVAQDALVVVVHPENPVQDLTLDQLRDVYQGRVERWGDVGGADLPVTVITREEGSGTRALFETQVMGARRITRGAVLVSSAEAVLRAVQENRGAVGYLSLAEVSEDVRVLNLNGVIPSTETVASALYPLRYTIYLAGLEEPQGLYRAFFGWIQSPTGQAAVGQRYTPMITNS